MILFAKDFIFVPTATSSKMPALAPGLLSLIAISELVHHLILHLAWESLMVIAHQEKTDFSPFGTVALDMFFAGMEKLKLGLSVHQAHVSSLKK
jgi:hypothetical protein